MTAGSAVPTNASWMRSSVSTVGALRGRPAMPDSRRVQVEHRHRHREQHRGGCGGGDHRMAERRGQHLRPHAVLATRAAQPAEERDAALLDAVAELRQERREHGERAEHRDRDDHDRADAERAERAVAGEEQPGHRGHDRQPGDEHRAARRRSCGLERGPMAAACRTLFTLTLEIEERVVDADGETDQEDDLRDRLVHRASAGWGATGGRSSRAPR